jgi:hypothetical protein
MKKSLFAIASGCAVLMALSVPVSAQWFLEFENGAALPGSNDVQIPRDVGTLFSLSEDLSAEAAYFARLRVGYQWKGRHAISALAAPFRIRAAGSVDEVLSFNGDAFAAGAALAGAYTFSNYRLTYRYDFVRKGRWRVGVGFTAFLRDAAITIEGDGRSSTKANVGFVPLLNFRVLWQFRNDWGLILEGDAAAAKQGRAEDVLLALRWRLNDRIALRAGYRILEGGADVEEVYNFALVHFLSAGVTYTF